MTQVVVHHLRRSRSHRILWLLEELGWDYKLIEYDRNPKTSRAPASLRKIHPLGKSPAVGLDGVIYAESGAIIEEILDRADGALKPAAGSEAHRFYRFFLHYAEGSLMAPLLVALITSKIRTAKLPFGVKQIAATVAKNVDKSFTHGELSSHGEFLESHLSSRTYLAGDELSGADIQMSYPVEALLSRQRTPLPKLQTYMDRLIARPAYQRALEKGGPVLL